MAVEAKLCDPTLSPEQRISLLNYKNSLLTNASDRWRVQLIRRVDLALKSNKTSVSLLVDLREYLSGESYSVVKDGFVFSRKKLGFLLAVAASVVIIIILLV